MILKLRQIRLERGLTQDQLAEMAGLSKGFLSQLETGLRQPSADTLDSLAAALRISTTELIADQGFAEPPAPASMARRVLERLDLPDEGTEAELKIGTDGNRVQIIATVDKAGLAQLIRRLEIMKDFLEA